MMTTILITLPSKYPTYLKSLCNFDLESFICFSKSSGIEERLFLKFNVLYYHLIKFSKHNWSISNQIKNNSCRNVFSGQLDCIVVGQMSDAIKLYFASVPMSRLLQLLVLKTAAAR